MGILGALKESIPEMMASASQKSKIKKMLNEAIKSNRRVSSKGIAELLDDDLLKSIFPKDLIRYVSSKYSENELYEKVVEFYIRHERAMIKEPKELEEAKKIGCTHVKIRTSADSRVCPVCKKHANKKYAIDKAPKLPLCWECRCYYEPVIKK